MMRRLSQIVGDFVKKLEEFSEEQKGSADQWDINKMEGFLRPALNKVGRELLGEFAQRMVDEAEQRVATCRCNKSIAPHRKEKIVFYTSYGQVEAQSVYHYCKRCKTGDNPFKRLTGLRGKGRSRMLEKILIDFGTEESFQNAQERVKEHYGFPISASTIRDVTLSHGNQSLQFIGAKLEAAVEQYEQSPPRYEGIERLLLECDGSDIRTGTLREMTQEERQAAEAAGMTLTQPKRDKPRRRKDTNWREVRLIASIKTAEVHKSYLATMKDSKAVGSKMFSLALLEGMDDATQVIGLADGAAWIAEEFKSNFPNGWFLLDKYHLLEHIYEASEGLKTKSETVKQRWVSSQIRRIEEGQIDKVVQDCRKKAAGNKDSPLANLQGYIEERKDFMQYRKAPEEGIPVGSGIVESGHRHVVQKRMKLPGTWWSEENVNPMCALRVLRANGWWDEYWRNISLTN